MTRRSAEPEEAFQRHAPVRRQHLARKRARPEPAGLGQRESFFAEKAGVPKPESYNYVWAGSAGGPIVRNRTFFWAATEGYRTSTVAAGVLTWPTEQERRGDFSQSFDAAGRLIVIYDPLTTRPNPESPGQFVRDPFPGNSFRPIVSTRPRARCSASTRCQTRANAPRALGPSSIWPIRLTTRLDHRVSGGYTIAGTYAWYTSTEPGPLFYDGLPSDPDLGELVREVHLAGINNLFTQGSATVYQVRYGFLRFTDDDRVPGTTSRGSASPQRFATQVPVQAFPVLSPAGYNALGAGFSSRPDIPVALGERRDDPTDRAPYLEVGADFRRLGLELHEPGTSGTFNFSRAFTQGPNPNLGATNAGDAIASLLLGLPASGNVQVGTPQRFVVRYYAGYVHDDFRASSNLTLNLGLRYEFEEGLRETKHQFTVGFDWERTFPVPVAGLDLEAD